MNMIEFRDIVEEVSPELLNTNTSCEGYDLEIYVNIEDIEDNLESIMRVISRNTLDDLFVRLLYTHKERAVALDKKHTIEKLVMYVGADGTVDLDLLPTKESIALSSSKEKIDGFVRLITTLDLLGIEVRY